MSDLPKTCPDCNAPVGPDMLPVGECWYWGQVRAKLEREGRDYGAWSHYNEWAARRSRNASLLFFGLVAAAIGLCAIVVWY